MPHVVSVTQNYMAQICHAAPQFCVVFLET